LATITGWVHAEVIVFLVLLLASFEVPAGGDLTCFELSSAGDLFFTLDACFELSAGKDPFFVFITCFELSSVRDLFFAIDAYIELSAGGDLFFTFYDCFKVTAGRDLFFAFVTAGIFPLAVSAGIDFFFAFGAAFISRLRNQFRLIHLSTVYCYSIFFLYVTNKNHNLINMRQEQARQETVGGKNRSRT
jgi:hypothetical protein